MGLQELGVRRGYGHLDLRQVDAGQAVQLAGEGIDVVLQVRRRKLVLLHLVLEIGETFAQAVIGAGADDVLDGRLLLPGRDQLVVAGLGVGVLLGFGSPSAEESGLKLAAALHAPDITAMRAMDADKLSLAAPAAGYAPWGTIDGSVLLRQLVDVFDKGEQAPVPILAGFNSGEIRSLRILAPQPPASAAEYEATIRARYGDLADEFLRLYPSSNLKESVLATTRDALYGWTAQRLVRKQTALGQPSYLYFFDHGYPAADAAGLHGFHASELPYVFGTFNGTPPLWPKIPATPQERTLSDAMIGYWSSFARSVHPQAAHEPDWPVFGPTGAYMAFKETPQPSDHLMPGMYEFNEETVCRRKATGEIGWNWNVGLYSPKLPPQQAKCKQ